MNVIQRFLKRSIYLAYYFKEMDWPKFRAFFRHVCKSHGRNGIALFFDAVASVYRYNIGLIDYFYFRFYLKNHAERSKWMGTGYKYEYDLLMNPVTERHILQNKTHFFQTFSPFVKHGFCTLEDIEADNERARRVLGNPTGKLAIKDALGQCGWQVEIVRVADFSREQLIQHMKQKGFNLAEEFIVQHSALAALSPSGLNTVRLITQITPEGDVDFIGPTLRMTVNSPVDNMAVGNIAAPIDITTGKIKGKGAYQDIRKEAVAVHPVTSVSLIGYQIPFWSDVLELCRNAALSDTRNKSIGWDVAITNDGPAFVEGNHNWCKLLWQLPAGMGLKHVLEPYRQAYKRLGASYGRVTSAERLEASDKAL